MSVCCAERERTWCPAADHSFITWLLATSLLRDRHKSFPIQISVLYLQPEKKRRTDKRINGSNGRTGCVVLCTTPTMWGSKGDSRLNPIENNSKNYSYMRVTVNSLPVRGSPLSVLILGQISGADWHRHWLRHWQIVPIRETQSIIVWKDMSYQKEWKSECESENECARAKRVFVRSGQWCLALKGSGTGQAQHIPHRNILLYLLYLFIDFNNNLLSGKHSCTFAIAQWVERSGQSLLWPLIATIRRTTTKSVAISGQREGWARESTRYLIIAFEW